MSDLRDLYQDVILEHSKTPRNYRELPAADHKAEGFNPCLLYTSHRVHNQIQHHLLQLHAVAPHARKINFEICSQREPMVQRLACLLYTSRCV